MATYWLTFRIHDDAGYQTRYSDFIDAVNEAGTSFWSEPTSFICLESTSTIDAICSALKVPLSTKDLVVMREIGKDSTRYIGVPGNGFSYFFPNAKTV